MADEDTGYDFGDDPPGVPAGEGETWDEAAERLRPDATVDLSCPNGCYELEVTAHHEAGEAGELIDKAVQEEPGPCPNCGAEIERKIDAN